MIVLLLEAAARALVLAIVAGTLLWVLRVRNVMAQRSAWTIVLLAACAMPALMRSPWAPAALQWRPASFVQPAFAPLSAGRSTAPMPVRSIAGLGSRSASNPSYAKRLPPISVKPAWPALSTVVFALYAAIAGILTLRLLIGLIVAIRLWRRATPIADLATSAVSVRVSAEVCSPVTIACGVVLPADYPRWTPEKLRAVLAHERAHVRHFDFHVQLLAGIYAAIFWFSPLGWWLRRRLAVLAEVICDRAGVVEAGTRSDYAEIVLHFAAMPRRPMTGVAMACTGNISRRIEQLLNQDFYSAAFSHGRKRASIAFLLIAFAVFTSSVMLHVPSVRAAQIAAPTPPAAAPAPPASAPTPPDPEPAGELTEPEAPEPPQASTDTQMTTVTKSHDNNVQSYSFGSSDRGGDSYAIIDGANTNITFSGDWGSDHTKSEIDKARRMANNGKFLWFRHAGKSYVVTDPAILSQLSALYAPIEELGRRQEELGKRQEALGRQQEALGKRQEGASVPTPDMSREIAELNATIAKLQAMKGKETTQEQLSEIQEKLGDLQGRIGDIQGKIGEKQGSFGAEQGRLGEEQGKLGEQQGRLGEQQGKLAQEADRKVKAVIQETLKNGRATPVQ